MENQLLFIGCLIISFVGVVMSSYSTQAEKSIAWYLRKNEQTGVMDPNMNKWGVGAVFANGWIHILGSLLTFGSGGLSLIGNAWWVSIIVIIGAIILFRFLVKIFRQSTQVLSLIALIIGIIVLIVSLV